MYSHVICVDVELQDIIEDGIDIPVNSYGIVIGRKSLIVDKKKSIKVSQSSWYFG